jgi:2'-5' RNA ligase
MPFSSFTRIFKTARSEANVASRDYPELEEVLLDRPPPNSHQAAGVDGLCALCNAEPATQEISGTTVGERCAEHLMGVPGAGTAPPEFGQAVYGSREVVGEVVGKLYADSTHTAGLLDWLDRKIGPMAPEQGSRWSFDWCRYRKNSHCFYPGDLDPHASQMMGQAVWHFQDRGNCPRFTWASQEICPIGAPGPNSGVPGAQPYFASRHSSLDQQDPDFHWHFMAAWSDVRARATKIRREGGVRIISAPDQRNPYIVAEVLGTYHPAEGEPEDENYKPAHQNTYQTTILRTIGGKSVAGWECTCAWAHYAWGRSGRWKKFEGRQCSHALATIYQAQAEEMFGGRVKEIERRPAHLDEPSWYKAPEQPIRGPNKSTWRTGSLHEASFSEERPIAMEVEARLEEGHHPNQVLAYLREAGAPWPEYILAEAIQKPFTAKDPANELHTIVSLDGEEAVTDAGERIPVEHLTHPDFDWHSGLEPPTELQMKSAKVQEDPTPHVNADGSPHSGVMVALVPPEKVRQGLAVQDGEPPEDMHVTVGYLGHKDSVDPEALHRAVGSFAQHAPPLRGKISGFGNFEVDPERNDGYTHAHVGLVDIPGIADFRSKLSEHLGREGLHINDEHGLQPHLTVAYGHEPAEYDTMPDTTGHFDLPHVTVAHGSTWTHYPLEGSKPASREGMLRWAAGPAAGELLNPHWQSPEAPKGKSKGRADDPNATKFSTYEPDFQKKISSQFHENVPSELGVTTHGHMVENIKAMYREAKTTNPKAVKEGMKWYGDAHNFAKGLAAKHEDGNLRKSIGMTAALSPQCHWEENKTQAEYFHHHLSAHPDSDDGKFNISPEHAQAAMDKQAEQASVVKGHKQVQQLTPGKRFADMDPEEAAHSLKAQAQYTHELKVPGRLKNDGEPWKATFANGTGSIAKAVRIHRGEDPDDVLQGHKVRSFFNNIADHNNRKKRDDVTIDTHAVSLAAGAKFGASSPAIKKMFSNGANKEQNVTGTYGYFADAYRKAHQDLVDSGEMSKNSAPHHLQATTWLHWRDINDEPGPLKEANKGRFADYSGTNAANQKKFKEEQAQKASPHQNPLAASLRYVAANNNAAQPDDSGKLLDPSNYDPEAIDPDFDPDLADEAEQAEWDAEPEEMAQRQADKEEAAQYHAEPYHPPRTSMLHWAGVQDSGISEDIDPGTADAMDEASSVQKDYNDQARQAQDDWYFNQPNQTKPFPEQPAHIPTYMSALPALGMKHWGAEAAEEMLHDELGHMAPKSAANDVVHMERGDPEVSGNGSAILSTGVTGSNLSNYVLSEASHGVTGSDILWGDPSTFDVSIPSVVGVRSEEPMPGVLARADIAGMEDMQLSGISNEALVAPTMGVDHMRPVAGSSLGGVGAVPELPVASWAQSRRPEPAGVGVSRSVDLGQIPGLSRMLAWQHVADDSHDEALLHDEPEGALPSTDGGAPSEDWDRQHSTTAADPISAGPAGFGSPLDPGYVHEDLGYPEADEAVLRPSGGPGAGSYMNDMENKFNSLDATGSLDSGAESRAWLLKGGPPRSVGGDQGIGDSDIAAMARQFLATGELPEKTAMKTFSPAEQQELIQEGSDGTRASNLDRLQLEGTHYQADEDDESLEGLFDV